MEEVNYESGTEQDEKQYENLIIAEEIVETAPEIQPSPKRRRGASKKEQVTVEIAEAPPREDVQIFFCEIGEKEIEAELLFHSYPKVVTRKRPKARRGVEKSVQADFGAVELEAKVPQKKKKESVTVIQVVDVGTQVCETDLLVEIDVTECSEVAN